MNEASVTRAFNKKLPDEIHVWKINARFANGVPDCWYSGPGGDMWVEWKLLPQPPSRAHKPRLSALQERWLNEQYDKGRNCKVVVALPKKQFLLYESKAWSQKTLPPQLTEQKLKDLLCTELL